MNCKDCKYWHEQTEDNRETPLGYGDCMHPKMINHYDVYPEKDGAVWDPGHDGAVFTGPIFGCIHFTPKP